MTIIQVKVKPGSSRSTFARADDGSYVAYLHARPVDGKANAELIEIVARHFDCAKSAVRIRSGASGRMKLVELP